MGGPVGTVVPGDDDGETACLHDGRTHRAEQLAGKAAAPPTADND